MRCVLLVVPFLAGCKMFPNAVGGSEAIERVAIEVPKIVADAASGNYVAAAIGAGSLLVGLLGWRGGKHVVKRMKDSQPGQII